MPKLEIKSLEDAVRQVTAMERRFQENHEKRMEILADAIDNLESIDKKEVKSGNEEAFEEINRMLDSL